MIQQRSRPGNAIVRSPGGKNGQPASVLSCCVSGIECLREPFCFPSLAYKVGGATADEAVKIAGDSAYGEVTVNCKTLKTWSMTTLLLPTVLFVSAVCSKTHCYDCRV